MQKYISPLQDEDGHLRHRDMDKAEAFKSFFASVFSTDAGAAVSQHSELEGHVCENDQLPVNPELVWDLLLQLDPYKFMDHDGVQLRILSKLADVNVSPHSMTFEVFRIWRCPS